MTKNNNAGAGDEQGSSPRLPSIGFFDLDSLVFAAASAAETTCYIAKDSTTGEEIGRFNKAKEFNDWLKDVEELGQDIVFDSTTLPENIERHVEHEINDVGVAYQTFDRKIKDWQRMAGVERWKGWVSAKAGDKENFRYGIATLHPYKGGREGMRKPHYLEHVREHALSHYPQISAVHPSIEVDDVVVLMSEKNGDKAVCVSVDKDQRQCHGTWILHVDAMDSPVFSDPSIIGVLEKSYDKSEQGAVTGYGHLFLLFQMLAGDKQVDNIAGCKGVGPVKALEVLGKYSGEPIGRLREAVWDVCEMYQDKYGEHYEYKHCHTREKVTAHWSEVFLENLRLLWMLRSKEDQGETIFQHVHSYIDHTWVQGKSRDLYEEIMEGFDSLDGQRQQGESKDG